MWLAVTRNLLLEGIKRLGIYVFADNCKQATTKVNPRSQSAATRVTGSTVLVCMTVYAGEG